MSQSKRRIGLTLVELFVVIGVVGLMLMVIIPGCTNATVGTTRAGCESNMRNVALAVQGYAMQNAESIPVGVYKRSRYTAHSAILPQVELANVGKLFGTFTGEADASQAATRVRIPIFICPSDYPSGTYSSPGGGVYARSNIVFSFGSDTMQPAVVAALGMFRIDSTSSFAVTAVDGAANTVLVSETISGKTATDPSGAWGYGEAGSCGYTHKNVPVSGAGVPPITAHSATDFSTAVATASSMHPGWVNVVYADMHAAQIATTIDPAIWKGMGISHGGDKATP